MFSMAEVVVVNLHHRYVTMLWAVVSPSLCRWVPWGPGEYMGALALWMHPKAPRPALHFIFLCFQRSLCTRYFLLLPASFPLTVSRWGFLKNFILLGNSHLVALKSKPLWLAPGPPLTDLFEKRLRWHPALLNMPPGKAV